MKKAFAVFIAGIFIASICILMTGVFASTDPQKIIDYTVTRDDSKPDNELLTILVSPRATKNQIIELIRYLREEYSDIEYVNIWIVDSKAVNLGKSDETYYKHVRGQFVIYKVNGSDQGFVLDKKTGKRIKFYGSP